MGLTNIQRIKLRTELAELYQTIAVAKTVVKDAGIPTSNIEFNSAKKQNWDAIINETMKHEKELDLIDIALAEYPQSTVLAQLKNELSSGDGDNSNTVDNVNNGGADGPPQVNPVANLDKQIALLKSFVAVGKFDDVLKKLITISASVSSSYNNSVIMISGQYHSLKQEKITGIISAQNAQLRENQIRYRLLGTIDELKSEVNFNNKLAEFNDNVNHEISNETIKESLLSKQVLFAQTDKELERVIGNRPNFVNKSWFLKALTAADTVGRIFLKRTGQYEGTGFLAKDGYLLTNEHVIRSIDDLEGSFIEFNFSDEENTDNNIYRFNFDPGFYHSSPYKSGGIPTVGAYDYALVKVLDNGKIPLSDLGHVSFESDIQPSKDDPVNIIQHPGGLVQQFSLTANEVIADWDHYLYYKADTKAGSSGSPVFNQDWKVVALHHAGQNEYDASGGLQIDSAGTIAPANRGILIKHIIKDLADKGIDI